MEVNTKKRKGFQIQNIVCDPPVVLAPMAAITNPPFRLLCREMGAGMVVTEMYPAVMLATNAKKRKEFLDIREDEHPVSVQILGSKKEEMIRASQMIEESGADMIDINMGCPMRKVVHSGNGAALLKSPSKIFDIIQSMTSSVSIPITVKIRAGWEESNATEVAKAIEDAGGSAIFIHARTRTDMFEGHPDLDVIAEVKRAVSIPVIGNGDVYDVESAQHMMESTQCDGVMVARGCMGNPWIFREIASSFQGKNPQALPSIAERKQTIQKHAELYLETYGETRTSLEIRKHLLWYLKETPGETILKNNFAQIKDATSLFQLIDQIFDECSQKEGTFEFPKGLKKHPNRRQSCS